MADKMHRVYSIVPRENAKDYWLNIGVAFPHKDGKGWNLNLQALPLNAKLIIREVDETAQDEAMSKEMADA